MLYAREQQKKFFISFINLFKTSLLLNKLI